MKVLNLYAGIGGNRKLWRFVEVTAVEKDPKIAKIYQDLFPDDKVIVGDAHKYLLEHFQEFDFIWSSPPCPTHSKIRAIAAGKHDHQGFIYPDMELYEEIIFLKRFAKCKWVVENVVSYYDPLIKPSLYGRHYFWSNFIIGNKKIMGREHFDSWKKLEKVKGMDISKYDDVDKRLLLRNCVKPQVGLEVFNMAFKESQELLNVT